jgi:hypothetical protein
MERAYFCACGNSHHLLKLTAWDDEPEGYLDITPCDSAYGIIERIRAAWNTLRGRDHVWVEVILNPETTDKLIADLTELKSFCNMGR